MPDRTRSFLQRWFVTTLGVLLAAGIIRGVQADSVVALLAASLLLGVLNAVLRPLLLILALPLVLITLGLFILVINALLLSFVGGVIHGFHVYGFLAALKGSLVISAVSFFGNLAGRKNGLLIRTAPSPSSAGRARPPIQERREPPPNSGSGPIIDI